MQSSVAPPDWRSKRTRFRRRHSRYVSLRCDADIVMIVIEVALRLLRSRSGQFTWTPDAVHVHEMKLWRPGTTT